ncbi:MAG: fimbria/pilus periplasmic chaperone [Rhizobiales bacterium]|nr:fimbria/pilus periplasmic chaperone [Hyphomicrobiales bacterium]
MQSIRNIRLAVRAAAASLALAAVVLLAAAPVAHAMSVTPIHIEMSSAGSKARAQIKVTNTSQAPLPVEIALERFVMDESGGRKAVRDGDNFLVFPPQALIAPGATQAFRIQWVGEPILSESESYMMSVNQLPVKLPEGKSAIQIVMSFGVVINVAPPQGAPDLSIVGTGVTTKSGKRHPTVTVANASNVHGLMTEGVLTLTAGSWSETLSPGFLREKVGIGLVQPGRKRTFTIPVELPAGVRNVTASLAPAKR